LPAVRSVRNTRLTASVARAVNAVQANQALAIGLLNGLLTALNRSDGAAKAGDTSAEQRQLNAARDFAKKAAKAISDGLPLRLTLATQWIDAGLNFSISERDALKLRNDIVINGFPRQFLDALKKLGLDRTDQDVLLFRLLAKLVNLTGFRETSFQDILMDPAWHAAELRAGSSLNQFSRSQ
jgi:hypothetical protein